MEQALWNGLLFLRKAVAQWTVPPKYCYFNILNQQLSFDQLPSLPTAEGGILFYFTDEYDLQADYTQFHWSEDFKLRVLDPGKLDKESLRFLQAYLPYCFCSIIAKKRKKAVAIAHFAQTLDGKIATERGHSRWIGNEENLKHAHRMRALCDAILIGRSTLYYDQPRLTVRHVAGNNPRRIVLGSGEADYSCLFAASADPVWVIGSQKNTSDEKITYCDLPRENGRLQSDQILECLYEKGCQTVYIEGGTRTTSNFLADRAVDVLQLHLSPQIFGSGRPAFVLPEIEDVEEAIQFSNFHYQTVGDTLMFVGHLKQES